MTASPVRSAALFFPQMLFAAAPEKKFTDAQTAAVLVNGRIEARTRAAAAMGVRLGIGGSEALGLVPKLQFVRTGGTAFMELSKILTLLALAEFPRAALVKSARSGAAALILEVPAGTNGATERLLKKVTELGFTAFAGEAPTPVTALGAAVFNATAKGGNWDAAALMADLEARTSLPFVERSRHFALRLAIPSSEVSVVAHRACAALLAWMRGIGAESAQITLSACDSTGRRAELPEKTDPHFDLLGADTEHSRTENARLSRWLVTTGITSIGGSIELTAEPADPVRTASPEEASPLVQSLTGLVGRQRVFRLECTGDPLPENAQRRIPAEGAAHSAHRRPPLAAPAGAPRMPTEVLSEPRELAVNGSAPTYGGPLEILENAAVPTGWNSRLRRYYLARSAAGEVLCIFRELGSGRWFLQGRYA
ncbi:hypothetical protein [Sutterella sp.]|uniref:hypothetical protein n=1 Tax=Sutterella sp. TaxID=1981025 RepID=UPI0026DFC8AD|nr:hypothetical protein [Sutterella sp.]MDO5531949.1 hypothetical protein [Sutterella sp.]